MMIVETDSGALIGCKTKKQKTKPENESTVHQNHGCKEQSDIAGLRFWVWICASFPFPLLTLSSQRQGLCTWCSSVVQTFCDSPAWTEGVKTQHTSPSGMSTSVTSQHMTTTPTAACTKTASDTHVRMVNKGTEGSNQTCFPPPLLGGMQEETRGPEAPLLVLFPVQLLQRISPWEPFFHMGEEVVLQTAQHGFSPSGIASNPPQTRRRAPRRRASFAPRALQTWQWSSIETRHGKKILLLYQL